MIQIRNVPDTLHRRLKSRAALPGMSLSDYLLNELREIAERPTMEKLTPSVPLAQAVRAGDRGRRLDAPGDLAAHICRSTISVMRWTAPAMGETFAQLDEPLVALDARAGRS